VRSLVAIAALLAVVAACSRDASQGKGGPAERAGRQADRALDKAGQSVEQAGRDMQDSAKGRK